MLAGNSTGLGLAWSPDTCGGGGRRTVNVPAAVAVLPAASAAVTLNACGPGAYACAWDHTSPPTKAIVVFTTSTAAKVTRSRAETTPTSSVITAVMFTTAPKGAGSGRTVTVSCGGLRSSTARAPPKGPLLPAPSPPV